MAYAKKCAKCGKVNHFANKCRSRYVNNASIVNSCYSAEFDDLTVGDIQVVSTRNKYGKHQ